MGRVRITPVTRRLSLPETIVGDCEPAPSTSSQDTVTPPTFVWYQTPVGAGSARARATSIAASRRTPLESVTVAVTRLAVSVASSSSAASASVSAPQLIRALSASTSTEAPSTCSE